MNRRGKKCFEEKHRHKKYAYVKNLFRIVNSTNITSGAPEEWSTMARYFVECMTAYLIGE